MPIIAISDMTLRKLSAPPRGQLDFWDRHFPSFGVRVSQGGTKTFVLKMHNSRRSLGRYGIITLAEAREQARLILAEKTLGKVRPQSISYQSAKQLFLEDKARDKKPRTVAEYKRLLDRLTFHGQVSEISYNDVAHKLSRIKSPSEHAHCVVVLRLFFNWCIKRRYRSDNPTTGLSKTVSTPRARVLSDDELKSIWRACEVGESPVQRQAEEPPLPAAFKTIVKLLILTGQRRGEIAALQTSWITPNDSAGSRLASLPRQFSSASSSNLWTLTIPASVTKNGREHTFPLTTLASTIITQISRSCTPEATTLFPARGKHGKPFNGWSKSKKALDELSGVQDWTLHDLRRTFRTIHGRIGTPPHIAERLVNHVTAQTEMERVYDQHRYLPEMRAAMDAYEAYVKKILHV